MRVLSIFKKCNILQMSRYQYSTNVQGVDDKRYIPRRAVLYVPGNDERKLNKIPSINADCVVLDCEDGVAVSKKDEARHTIKNYLQKDIFKGKDCSVRVNSVDSGLCEEDMKVILSSPVLPMTLHLPKVENTNQIKWFSEQLKNALGVRSLREKIRLMIFVESATSLLNLASICEKAIELSSNHQYLLDGIVFGSDDFCADIGATRTSKAEECLFARQYTVTVAKAFKLQAVDLVYIDYKDIDGLKKQSEEGAKFGFTGKQVIHPGQVETVIDAFTPSAEKIEWASSLINSFDQHQKDGKGAFTFKGSMIDMPLVRQAKNILQMVSK